jgi:hypothetical protein
METKWWIVVGVLIAAILILFVWSVIVWVIPETKAPICTEIVPGGELPCITKCSQLGPGWVENETFCEFIPEKGHCYYWYGFRSAFHGRTEEVNCSELGS